MFSIFIRSSLFTCSGSFLEPAKPVERLAKYVKPGSPSGCKLIVSEEFTAFKNVKSLLGSYKSPLFEVIS